MNALVKTEKSNVPALLAKGKTPSLPAWAGPLQSALAVNLQKTGTGFADILTLPATMVPDEAKRRQIEAHQHSLTLSLNETPENGEHWAAKTAEIVSKAIYALGGQKGELASEAKGEACAIALEDVPWWAVEAAMRSWYRRECKDEDNKPFDYDWAPSAPTLRWLAMCQVSKVKYEIHKAQNLLDAKPYFDCSADLEKGRAAMAFVFKNIGNTDALKGVTFDQAAEQGRALVAPASAKGKAA